MAEITMNGSAPLTGWGYVSEIRSADDFLEEKITEMLKRLAPPEYTEVRCRECGGEIDQKWDDHIIKCPYCNTVYVIGRKMLNG